MTDALSPIDQSLLPADVRNGSAQRRQEYEAALSFERVLVGQMTQQLASTLGSGKSDDADSSLGQSDAATQQLRQTLPGTLADALMAGGGIGLAAQLDAAWHPGASSTTTTGTTATGGAATGTTATGGGAAA